MAHVLVIGGTGGLGKAIAQHLLEQGSSVLVAGRDLGRAEAVATELGGDSGGAAVDLGRPDTIADALAGVPALDGLVITAIHQAFNTVANFSIEDAVRAATVKLVGYTETVRALQDRFTAAGSVVLFGGGGKDRPYPGSTLVSANNGGVSSLTRSLAMQVAPVRVNALHPGLVVDSPAWTVDGQPAAARTLSGIGVTMADVADATTFLLRNQSMNASDLYVDGGVRVMNMGPNS